MAKNSYKQKHPLDERQEEAAGVRQKYPDRIPVIVEKAEKGDINLEIDEKYLVPGNLAVYQFAYVIWKRAKLGAEKNLFLFVNNVLPPDDALLSSVYEDHKDEDGLLYMTYKSSAVQARSWLDVLNLRGAKQGRGAFLEQSLQKIKEHFS